MKYKDLESFTYNELSHFTHADLMLGKLELFEKANNNLDIPKDIVDKLYNLCNDVTSQYKVMPGTLPKNKERLTLKMITDFMRFVITLKEFVPESLIILKALLGYFKQGIYVFL